MDDFFPILVQSLHMPGVLSQEVMHNFHGFHRTNTSTPDFPPRSCKLRTADKLHHDRFPPVRFHKSRSISGSRCLSLKRQISLDTFAGTLFMRSAALELP